MDNTGLKTLQSKNISTIAFWDIDPLEVDLERDSLIVMSRVFNYGKWSDIVAVLNYYGVDRIRQEIVQATWLKGTALSFLCLVLGLESRDFKTMNQRNPRIWESK